MRYWNISVFDIKFSMRFWNIWIVIFQNISENALSNIIGQCAQCVQCVIEINPFLKSLHKSHLDKLLRILWKRVWNWDCLFIFSSKARRCYRFERVLALSFVIILKRKVIFKLFCLFCSIYFQSSILSKGSEH